jgi:O-antigen ligase
MTLTLPALPHMPRQLPWAARLCTMLLLVRASCDPLLEAAKSQSNGMGLGAALNALMLAIAARYALFRPQPLMAVVLPMWAPFLLAGLASVAIAPDASGALRLLLVQTSYCAAFALPFWLIRTNADRQRWLNTLLLSSLIPVCWALIELALGSDAQGDGLYRLQGTFSHPNIFAFYLVLMIALILYLQKAVARPAAGRRRLLWLYMLLLLALLMLTKTRSAWGGCALVFAVYGLLVERRFLLYLLAAPLVLLLDSGIRDRLLDVTAGAYDQDGNLNSYAWRVLLWRAGLGWMEGAHTLYGYGLEAFRYYSPRFFPLQGQDSWDPHNVYVQLYFETGAAGVLAYAWLYCRLLPRLWRNAPNRTAAVIVLAMTAAYLLTSYSDNMLYYLSFNWYFWFFIGAAAVRVHDSEKGRAP